MSCIDCLRAFSTSDRTTRPVVCTHSRVTNGTVVRCRLVRRVQIHIGSLQRVCRRYKKNQMGLCRNVRPLVLT